MPTPKLPSSPDVIRIRIFDERSTCALLSPECSSVAAMATRVDATKSAKTKASKKMLKPRNEKITCLLSTIHEEIMRICFEF